MNNRWRVRLLIALTLGGLATVLVGLIFITGTTVQAAPGGPPGPPPPQPTPLPSASLTFLEVDKTYSPNPVQTGQLVTYSLHLKSEGALDARNAGFELDLVGNQTFVNFDKGTTAWTLTSEVTNTVRVRVGSVEKGQEGFAKITAIAPTNLSQPFIRQNLRLSWEDTNGAYTKTFSLAASLNAPPPGATVPPVPPPVAPIPNGPTDGPFAAQANPGTPNTPDRWYFPATSHFVSFGFLTYWQQHGAVTTLGWPLSEEFNENGQTVQYFERGILEYHPDNPADFKVELRALGREAGQAQDPVDGTTAPSPGATYYTETGHWMDARFAAYWQKNGGLAQFGYPIGEARLEGDKLVQWFERARFELDTSKPNQLITLGLVGRESAVTKKYL